MESNGKELLRRIELSGGTDQLRGIRSEFHDSFGATLSLNDTKHSLIQCNAIHDEMIKKAVYFAEQQVGWKSKGYDQMLSYAFLLFGSGGRSEQTLSSDQDNGIAFEPMPGVSPEEAEERMVELANAICAQLEALGYPPCNGNVLASNPFWRRTAGEWDKSFIEWAEAGRFEMIRHLLIAADARRICGSGAVSDCFTSGYATAVYENREAILPRMLENTMRHKLLIGVFGNLLTEAHGVDAGGIDLKYGAYIPMVNSIRLLALRERLSAASTIERIGKLEQCGAISSVTAEDWESAFLSVIHLRSMIPAHADGSYYTNSGKLPGGMLTKEVKKQLKQALRIGAELQKAVKRSFAAEGC